MSEITNLNDWPIHPAAECFPMIDGQAFIEFKADIAANGQKDPITLNAAGVLLDGRNRLRACRELGIEPKTETRDEPDEIAYILSKNTFRRHLDKTQAAACAAELANLAKHSNQYQKKKWLAQMSQPHPLFL